MPDLSITIVSNPGGGALFDPGSLAAPQLTGVSWNNTTGISHQIRLTESAWETQEILPGEGSRPLYVVPGDAPENSTIPYECALHPDEVGSIYVSPLVNLNE
jgi:hypothetical protein